MITYREHRFCCNGCKQVYQLLQDNNLGRYYSYEKNPGLTITGKRSEVFAYLDDSSIQTQLLDFVDGDLSKVTFKVSKIHCSSCIWLLENLFKLKKGISNSSVNFLKKEVSITFSQSDISLREIVEILSSLGYEPDLQLDSRGQAVERKSSQFHYFAKIGVAGFCFSNIMFLSFPEYLAVGEAITPKLKHYFEFLNFLFSLPVFFYCASDYYINAYRGLKQRVINIDVPITLGVVTLFARSTIDIMLGIGPGYFDSLTGLIFFLLVGKAFQQKTFNSLSFDRDYQSYFPLSVTLQTAQGELTVPVKNLKKDQIILVRNNELIPTDACLLSESCEIDYSFVTGESIPVYKKKGELIYAGGRLIGTAVEFRVIKAVSQSYLTSLWNDAVFNKGRGSNLASLSNSAAKYFTPLIIFVALSAGLYWGVTDLHKGIDIFSAVLIIACPCALALSAPFTLGTALRIFGKNRFYLKDSAVIESLSGVDTLVFDKTGTLTRSGSSRIVFNGTLSDQEAKWVKVLTHQSTHPLSQSIYRYLKIDKFSTVKEFKEYTGKGLQGKIDSHEVHLGKLAWLQSLGIQQKTSLMKAGQGEDISVHLAIDGIYKGCFSLSAVYRSGLADLFDRLRKRYQLFLLSGDQEQDKERLTTLFTNRDKMGFNQSPEDKLNYITSLTERGMQTLMIGDGLNDSGALKASSVGISISEDLTAFSPGCDGILDSRSFHKLDPFLRLARQARTIIIFSFILSGVYNIIGLSLAVQGYLSPLISAILMPISSTTVVLFTTGAVYLAARRLKL